MDQSRTQTLRSFDVEASGPPPAHPLALLTVSGIAKRYGRTEALRDVALSIHAGKIHALLGENGAGKSTLVKIILGAVQPDGGEVVLDGHTVRFRSVREALALGIFPIYQHFSQFPHLTVRENLAAFELGCTASRIAARALPSDEQARNWLAEVGLDIDLDETVGQLSVGERQLLEIARSVSQDARILVLDEPTAALTQQESEHLFAVVRRLCDKGCGVLLISHKLEEVERFADCVTIIRDGVSTIEGVETRSLSRADMVAGMLGREVKHSIELAAPREQTVFEARNIRLRPDRNRIDLSLRAGEIVGLAGIVGCGTDRLAAVLGGAASLPGAEIVVDGVEIPAGDRRQAIAGGIGYVPPDRHSDGVFDIISALANSSASRLAAFARGGMHSGKAESRAMRPLLERIALAPLDLAASASSFSGGNQQKLVVARNLAIDPLKVLVLSEPTRGVDIGARHIIHEAVVEAAASGTAVIVATSDIDELVELAHRILIVRRHEIGEEMARGAGRDAVVAALAEARP